MAPTLTLPSSNFVLTPVNRDYAHFVPYMQIDIGESYIHARIFEGLGENPDVSLEGIQVGKTLTDPITYFPAQTTVPGGLSLTKPVNAKVNALANDVSSGLFFL